MVGRSFYRGEPRETDVASGTLLPPSSTRSRVACTDENLFRVVFAVALARPSRFFRPSTFDPLMRLIRNFISRKKPCLWGSATCVRVYIHQITLIFPLLRDTWRACFRRTGRCLSPPGDGNLFSSPVKVSISWSSTRDSHRSIDLERKILANCGELIFNSRAELYTSFGLEDFFFIFSSRVNRGFFLFSFFFLRCEKNISFRRIVNFGNGGSRLIERMWKDS